MKPRFVTVLLCALLGLVLPAGAASFVTPPTAGVETRLTVASNALWTGDQSVNMGQLGYYHKQITSGTGPTKIALIADTAEYYDTLVTSYYRMLGSNGFDIPGGNIFLALTTGTPRYVVEGPAVATNWFGSYYELPQNAVYRTTNSSGANGGSIYCNRIGFRTIDYGEGGTLSFWSKANGGIPVFLGTLNTAGPHKHSVVYYDVLAGWYQVVVSNFTAGTVRFLGALQYDTNSSGFTVVGGTTAPGFDSDNISIYATNISYSFFTSAAPCLTFYTEISDPISYTTNTPAIATWITNTFQRAGAGSFVMNGTWPQLLESAGLAQCAAMRNICLSNGIPYFDSTAPFGNYTVLTVEFGANDGSHLTTSASKAYAYALWRATGTDAALAIGASLKTLGGQVPTLGADNLWGGFNRFGRFVGSYGADGGFIFYDRTEYPGNSSADMKVYYSGRNLWFYNTTLGGPVAVWNGNTVRNQSLVPFDTPSLVVTNSLAIETAGTLNFKSGTNTRAGNATLVAGTVTVNNTTVTANTVVMITRKTAGGTIGTAMTYTVSAGASFTITSNNVLDTSTVSYLLLENN